jgi:hypothetical protein
MQSGEGAPAALSAAPVILADEVVLPHVAEWLGPFFARIMNASLLAKACLCNKVQQKVTSGMSGTEPTTPSRDVTIVSLRP